MTPIKTHEYRKKLRSHTQRLRQNDLDRTFLICNITAFFLENEFNDYMHALLEDLQVDINSFLGKIKVYKVSTPNDSIL